MAIARQTDNKLVKPLGGCIIRRKQAGGTVEAGEAVYLDSAGKVQVTAANAVATNYAYGMSLQDAASGIGLTWCSTARWSAPRAARRGLSSTPAIPPGSSQRRRVLRRLSWVSWRARPRSFCDPRSSRCRRG